MNFFDSNDLYNNLSYVNYPEKYMSTYRNNNDYSITNNNTYSQGIFQKPIYNNTIRDDYSIKNYYTNNNDKRYISNTQEKRVMNDSALEKALEMIKNSVMDELDDENFYSMLLNQAIREEDKDIISSIRDDEIKHNKILRDIYYSLTGITLPQTTSTKTREPMMYVDNLKQALLSETKAAQKYMQILKAMPDKKSHLDILEILIDELRHGIKYNLLISTVLNDISNNRTSEVVKDAIDENIEK